MFPSPIYIGIDLGTSGIRICGIDEQGNPLIEVSQNLPASRIDGTNISQHAEDWQHVLKSLFEQIHQQADLTQLKAIAIDGTSGSVLLTDEQGYPVSEALMYNDARSTAQVQQLKAITDNSVVQTVSAGLPKLMWLCQHTDAFQFVMHQADWVQSLFTGILNKSDVNNCLKTGYDPVLNRWPEWIEQLPELSHKLPVVIKPGEFLGQITQQAAEEFQLPESTLLMAGTTDSHAAILATGISQTGEAVTSLGSTLVTKVISDTPVFNKTFGVYSQPFADKWLVGGGSNSGGAVLRDYFTDEQMQVMTPALNPQLDTGLNYYPLSRPGERFPVNEPNLTPRIAPRPENDAQFFQGLLEGIANIEHQAYQKLQELGAPYPTIIKTVGGGAKNDKWTQIRQRYCHTKVEKSRYTEASYGSALLAKTGYQNYTGVEE